MSRFLALHAAGLAAAPVPSRRARNAARAVLRDHHVATPTTDPVAGSDPRAAETALLVHLANTIVSRAR